MATCVDLISGLDPSCDALSKVGGVKKRVWVTQLAQLNQSTPFSVDGDGYIDAITMALDPSSVAYKLKKFIGKKSKNAGTYELTIGENVNTYNTSFTLVLYHFTPEDREAIESLVNAEDVVVFAETEAGQIEVFGIEQGLMASAGTGGTGTLLNDNTAFSLTLSGEQKKLPYLFDSGTGLAGSISYLDGLS